MNTRNISVTLEEAREWYNSGNATLKEIALQAFNESALRCNFRLITTFKEACEALDIEYGEAVHTFYLIYGISRASAAMFKLNIIRNALNLDRDLHLTKSPGNSYIYYPHNPLVTVDSDYYKSKIKSGKMEIIGKIKSEDTIYYVLGGDTCDSDHSGFGAFYNTDGVGFAYANIGFLGCASKEIAQHFGKHFGMLITEAKYGDMVDFEILSE